MVSRALLVPSRGGRAGAGQAFRGLRRRGRGPEAGGRATLRRVPTGPRVHLTLTDKQFLRALLLAARCSFIPPPDFLLWTPGLCTRLLHTAAQGCLRDLSKVTPDGAPSLPHEACALSSLLMRLHLSICSG